jgi:hypothetical protein
MPASAAWPTMNSTGFRHLDNVKSHQSLTGLYFWWAVKVNVTIGRLNGTKWRRVAFTCTKSWDIMVIIADNAPKT